MTSPTEAQLPEALDPNKIAAEFIKANMEKAVEIAAGQVKAVRNRIRSKLERTYSKYVRRLLDRHSKAKSFFARSEAIPLYDFFVPLDLSTQRRTLSSPGAAKIAAISPFAIITGTGGSGKSMIMRHLLISALEDREKTPIFLELRRLDQDNGGLEEALLKSLQDNGLDIDEEYLRLALAAGHFLLLLDGFDELHRKSRTKISKAVQQLAEKYPSNWITLSSRADPQLEGWNAFTIFRVEPLDLSKAVALVNRLTFDDEIKARFIADLKADLFTTHESFLSNPLLLSIMLLTYQDTALIPTKLSIFYNQAYESLFQRHDALKGGYQRPRRTSLDVQDFARVFAAFCVRTYDKRQFTFSAGEALEVFDACRSLTGLDYDSKEFLEDAHQAVCLLVEEGLYISFVHRSFQEYFAARFIAMSAPQIKGQLIRRFARMAGEDAVIALLHEIDPYAVEQHYILPAIQRVKQQIGYKRSVGVTHFLKYLRLMFSSFSVQLPREPGDARSRLVATLADTDLFHAVIFIHKLYGNPERIDATLVEGQYRAAEALEAEFGDDEAVPATQLKTTSPFVRALMDTSGMWGKKFLSDLITIESSIRERHSTSELSLDAILG